MAKNGHTTASHHKITMACNQRNTTIPHRFAFHRWAILALLQDSLQFQQESSTREGCRIAIRRPWRRRATKSAFYAFWNHLLAAASAVWTKPNWEGTNDHGQEKTSTASGIKDTERQRFLCTEVSLKYHDDGSSDRCKSSIGVRGDQCLPSQGNKLKWTTKRNASSQVTCYQTD